MDNQKQLFNRIIKRLLIVLAISVGLAGSINEILYRLQNVQYDRPPMTVELVIPEGTSELIASGQPVSDIPEEMVFVAGDVLVVKNEDSQPHQLGPLWIPAMSSASLNLEEPVQYSARCSFQPSRYMGLDVREPTTFWTRVQGVILVAPPVGIFLFLYSLVVYPLQPENKITDNRRREGYTQMKDQPGERES
jgi:hypothetical protein